MPVRNQPYARSAFVFVTAPLPSVKYNICRSNRILSLFTRVCHAVRCEMGALTDSKSAPKDTRSANDDVIMLHNTCNLRTPATPSSPPAARFSPPCKGIRPQKFKYLTFACKNVRSTVYYDYSTHYFCWCVLLQLPVRLLGSDFVTL